MADSEISYAVRRCTTCKVGKPETPEYFYFSKGRKPGQIKVTARCKACSLAKAQRPEERAKQLDRNRRWYQANKEYADGRRRGYRKANPERYRKLGAKYRAAIPDDIKVARWAEARVKGADRIESYTREYNARPSVKQREKDYREANRERHLANRRTASVRRYNTRPDVKLSITMTNAIWHALRRKKNGQSWERLVGYTRAELAIHLQRQFTKGMSWANLGRWHIDHIVPKCLFKYETADYPDFRACWALTNLRPLWGPDNIKKQAKRTHLL